MYSVVKNKVPFVLTGSIRDDGPLPEVIGDAYRGQSEMRGLVKKCTTIICLATMLHTIAAGNMTPSFRVLPDGTVRQVYLYSVDADEFVVNKLLDRGSLAATTIVTNVHGLHHDSGAGTGRAVKSRNPTKNPPDFDLTGAMEPAYNFSMKMRNRRHLYEPCNAAV